MASQALDVTSTCLICFETRALKIVGNCRHSFCLECLSVVIGSLGSGSEVFACPYCKVDCPRPWDGAKGLVDYTGNAIELVDANTERAVVPKENGTEHKRKGEDTIENATFNVICDLCDHKQRRVQAANICSECDNLQICIECSNAHGTNIATNGHILTPLLTKRQGRVPMCKRHHKLLIRFCLTCETPVCTICVSLDHGDHDIERLANIVKSKVDEVRVILEAQTIKRNDLQRLKKELILLNAKAPLLDKRDILKQEIEEHAQKCVEQIVTWKEDLKKQVDVDYKLIQDIPVGLEKVSKMAEKLDRPINTAAQLLLEIEEHPVYLDKLLSVQQEFQAIQGEDATDKKEFQSRLFNLNADNHFFSPDTVQPSYGKITKAPTSGKFEIEEVFRHKMQVASDDMFIPCVAVLGHKYYAVAHPVKYGHLAEAIDIYEFPGILRGTLRDLVAPLYDMTYTPDGKIAVLSGGRRGSNCSVKLFDPEAGYVRSTKDIDITEPFSIGVTLENQFVILGADDHGQTKITVVDMDGAVKHDCCLIDSEDDYYSNTISCGGRFIFLNGDPKGSVYELQDTGLKKITTCFLERIALGMVMGITATMWDNLFLTDLTNELEEEADNVYLTRIPIEQNKLEWGNGDYVVIQSNVSGADEEARVSTRDGHTVVVSHGQTIRVFRC